jgi:hypothetical protein
MARLLQDNMERLLDNISNTVRLVSDESLDACARIL